MADSFSLPICPPLLLAQSHRYQFETEAEDDAYAQRGKILLRKERENQAAGLPVGEYKPKEAPPAEKKAWFGRDAAPTPATPPKEKEKGVYAKMKESGYRPGAVSSAREAAKASASGRERTPRETGRARSQAGGRRSHQARPPATRATPTAAGIRNRIRDRSEQSRRNLR